ncbi:5-formyltetrahydrofolate cyclo-ligase [Olivibacter sp. SDN3]|uniref:5-formyltetrahydrofolate cyclo-ligase n=1 Tax=Olivibacter sp. SDN3 TaxID=2764720 RepID=UPI00165126A8|nr:5-formyltetrahydrofolate cyclo-ligase [Olivibacter sp. SDN3]QNL51340.1 5-formyltetrahydrofolate cyclo-ligase [Olivibacter sp. SDN3]
MFTKDECRKKFKEARRLLTLERYTKLNERILFQFMKLPLEGVSYIHTFLPIEKYREPNTLLIIEYLRKAWPSIGIVVPRADLYANSMTHYVLGAEQELISNKWGILEPAIGDSVDINLIDMVLLPLLAFDKQGNRVGYGKGYYDRFLQGIEKKVQKVGISLFDPVEQIMDSEAHDVPLDKCLTPDKLWLF